MPDQASERTRVPERARDLLSWDKKSFAQLALVRKNGTPHVSPVWFDWDGENIVINTARGRVKDHRLRQHPVVSLAIADPQDPYRYVLLTGPVVEETEEGAYDMICRLNLKYHGHPNFPKVPGQVRVTYKIRPDKVFASN